MHPPVNVVIFLLLLSATLHGQAFKKEDYFPLERLPRVVQTYQQALGDRLHVPGKERAISNGTLTDSRGVTNAILSWELPGRLRLDRPGSASLTVTA